MPQTHVIIYDEELADRIAEKVALIAVTMLFGPSEDAPLSEDTLTNREAYNQGFMSQNSWDLAVMMHREDDLFSTSSFAHLGTDQPEIIAHEEGGVSTKETALFLTSVAAAILLRRPARIKATVPRLFGIKAKQRLLDASIYVRNRVINMVLKRGKRVKDFVTGYLVSEAVENAIIGAFRMRYKRIPTRAVWSTIFLGVKAAVTPLIMDELIGATLPQSPQSPRLPSKTGVTRPGRRPAGPRAADA